MKNNNLYFVVFKGSLGKEIFLTDQQGLESISNAYDKKEHLKFLSYKPDNLQHITVVTKKYETIAHIEVIGENEHTYEEVKNGT